MTPTGIEALVCEDISARQEVGIATYGMTLEENPLSLSESLTEGYHEALDLSAYLKKAIMVAKAMKPLVHCRDCIHWQCPHPEWLENQARDLPPEKGWVDGVCKRLRQGITIEVSGAAWGGGATVDSVETDANFACIYGEEKQIP